ncbi:MAG TPA: DMT family transporter [Kofleriaceae bacterium]
MTLADAAPARTGREMIAGVVMVTAAAASWGTWSLFLRPTGLPSFVTAPLMFAIMAIVAFPLTLRERPARWDRTTVLLLCANTLSDALNVITFFAALTYTTVAIAVLTHYLAPILIALASPRIEGTSPRGARGSAAVALTGLVIMLEPWHSAADGVVIGALLGAVSAIAYAANVFVVRRLAERIGPARVMSYHSALAAVVMLPFAVSGLATVSWTDLGLLAAGSTTIGALSGVVFIAGLARIGAARTAVLTFAEPLVAVAVGALVWGEPLRPLAGLGGLLVLAAGIHVARQAG